MWVFGFSAIFGFFESGVFDITIPVNGEINEVILKTRMSEISVWNAQTGLLTQSEQYGVYVKQERNDVYFCLNVLRRIECNITLLTAFTIGDYKLTVFQCRHQIFKLRSAHFFYS